MAGKINIRCTNVFKSSDKEPCRNEFNRRWTELINQYEKNKVESRTM